VSAELPSYVLITPARNEESNIERTIKSVINQTVRPLRWIVVDDGSTDATAEIIERYTRLNSWIQLIRREKRSERHFGGKAESFNCAYEQIKPLKFDLVGNLDADLSFEEAYFEYLLQKFQNNARLGVAGTPFKEDGKHFYDYRYMSTNHVSGACQIFRRECYEQIGGYVPVKGGGVDLIAVITARMKGWETRSFLEKAAVHHRSMGSAKYSPAMIKYRIGLQDYAMGGHPVWELFRASYQMVKRPRIIGGLMIAIGYYTALIRRTPRPVSEEFVRFRRREQMTKLASWLRPTRKS
jgi:poly-beta-1,6-N-acetyl-D-glucosamine synthase